MYNFWENSEWEKTDKHLVALDNMPFKRSFPLIPDQSGLYLIRGPRQIGKSSWLKHILSHFTRKRIPSFYLSCENLVDHKELAEFLKSVRNRKVVLLDEISFVKDWSRAVKHELDSGHTNILVITGSHSADLRLGADLMPGRFGGGGEYPLLPMTFDEVTQARKQAKWHGCDRRSELTAYFRTGGFPTVVAEGGKSGKFPEKSMDIYKKWLVGDVLKLGKNEKYLRGLLSQIALTMQTPIRICDKIT